MKQVALIISFISIFGCQSIVENVPLPETEVKAVAFGYFDNLNLANKQNISLTKSKPVFYSANSQSSDYEPIQDAQITITGNGDNYEFYYEPRYERIRAKPSGQPSIRIRVYINSKQPRVWKLKSTQTMPLPLGAYTIRIDSTEREYDTDYRVSIELDNPLNQYYRIEVFGQNLSMVEAEGIYVDREYFKLTGSEKQLSTSFTEYNKTFGGDKRYIYLVISSITEDYYNYGRLLKDYNPQNPFGEPTLLPSNLEGGLGDIRFKFWSGYSN